MRAWKSLTGPSAFQVGLCVILFLASVATGSIAPLSLDDDRQCHSVQVRESCGLQVASLVSELSPPCHANSCKHNHWFTGAFERNS
jgi:hypothetical protein